MTTTEATTCERYCVFHWGTSWFALPALAVREIHPVPKIVPIPTAPSVLAGVCHIRNEFLPVVRLLALTESDGTTAAEKQVLVLDTGNTCWGLLTERVVALEALEPTHVSDATHGEWSSALLGSAIYRDQIVKVLEPQRLLRRVESVLDDRWMGPHDSLDTAHDTSTSHRGTP